MRYLVPTLVALALVGVGCSTSPDADLAARMAALEGRMADIEAEVADTTGEPAVPAAGTPQTAATAGEATEDIPEKDEFARAATDSAVKQEAGLEDAEVRFLDATDTLLVRAPNTETDDLDRAWDAAQRLADLWDDLESYQPVLDLKVGEVRCACSAKLMTDIGNGTADRTTWESACA